MRDDEGTDRAVRGAERGVHPEGSGAVDAVTGTISSLPAPAARMLAVEILLADPEALGDDVLESCLYLLRERLRAAWR